MSKVLIVDDEVQIRRFLRADLTSGFHRALLVGFASVTLAVSGSVHNRVSADFARRRVTPRVTVRRRTA